MSPVSTSISLKLSDRFFARYRALHSSTEKIIDFFYLNRIIDILWYMKISQVMWPALADYNVFTCFVLIITSKLLVCFCWLGVTKVIRKEKKKLTFALDKAFFFLILPDGQTGRAPKIAKPYPLFKQIHHTHTYKTWTLNIEVDTKQKKKNTSVIVIEKAYVK